MESPTREVLGLLFTGEMSEGGTGGKGLPSVKGDSKAELEENASNELCFPSKGALRLDAGVTERFEGLVGRVAGLLSSEGRLRLGVGGSAKKKV